MGSPLFLGLLLAIAAFAVAGAVLWAMCVASAALALAWAVHAGARRRRRGSRGVLTGRMIAGLLIGSWWKPVDRSFGWRSLSLLCVTAVVVAVAFGALVRRQSVTDDPQLRDALRRALERVDGGARWSPSDAFRSV